MSNYMSFTFACSYGKLAKCTYFKYYYVHVSGTYHGLYVNPVLSNNEALPENILINRDTLTVR